MTMITIITKKPNDKYVLVKVSVLSKRNASKFSVMVKTENPLGLAESNESVYKPVQTIQPSDSSSAPTDLQVRPKDLTG